MDDLETEHHKWICGLKPGDEVCDCRYIHQTILSIDLDKDETVLADGYTCSPQHCLDPVSHGWEHP